MIKLYQKEWHNIEFNNFTNCDKNNIATEEFYDKFYKEFFKKYHNFDDLNSSWVKYKISIADKILEEINDKKNILSIGCGIGIVEKYIVNKLSNINLTAIEPSKNVSRWIKDISTIDLKDGYFPNILVNKQKFDFVYANGIDYVFNNNDYDKFLKSIVDYGIKEFIMISASYYIPSTKVYVKDFIKDILSSIGLYNRYQFWGYQRSIDEQFSAMEKAGFNNISLIYQSNNTIIIKAVI